MNNIGAGNFSQILHQQVLLGSLTTIVTSNAAQS